MSKTFKRSGRCADFHKKAFAFIPTPAVKMDVSTSTV
jgi:hypothetical protein